MNRLFLSTICFLALFFGFVLLASNANASASKALSVAKKELNKGVHEKDGNNIPRYKKGKIAPYSIGGIAWAQPFVSWVAIKSGDRSFRSFSKKYGVKSNSGMKLLANQGLLISWAQKNKRIAAKGRPGDLAVMVENGWPAFSGIISKVNSAGIPRKVIVGNYNDTIGTSSVVSKGYKVVIVKLK